MAKVDASRRTDALKAALKKMETSTNEASRCCEQLTRRARQLDSLTSPASDASSMLSRANANLAATLILLKDAREKFDTVSDCEPAIERLYRGVNDMAEEPGNICIFPCSVASFFQRPIMTISRTLVILFSEGERMLTISGADLDRF